MSAPRCDRCGGPAFNVNRDGEHTGQHRDLEECVRAIVARLEPKPGPKCSLCERTDCAGPRSGCLVCGECATRAPAAAHGPGLCGDTNQCWLCRGFLVQKDGTIGNHGKGLCVTMDRNGRVVRPKKQKKERA